MKGDVLKASPASLLHDYCGIVLRIPPPKMRGCINKGVCGLLYQTPDWFIKEGKQQNRGDWFGCLSLFKKGGMFPPVYTLEGKSLGVEKMLTEGLDNSSKGKFHK